MNYTYSVVNANSLGEAWLDSLYVVLHKGNWIKDGPDNLLEVCNLYIAISSVSDDDPIISRYADKSRIDLMRVKHRSCQIVHNYKVSYGKLLYDNAGVNQIDWVIDRIRNKPETKSATISLHHPGDDYLSCLSLLDFKLRNGCLNITAVYRSQNVFGSQPGNVLAILEIHRHVAKQLGVQVGEFCLALLSAHIYERDIEKAGRICKDFGIHRLERLVSSREETFRIPRE